MIDDSRLKEEMLSGEEVYNGNIIRVERWQVRLPDGKEAVREIVRHRGAVAIVPLDDDGCVTLVRQDRVAVGRLTWEIPAGKLEKTDKDRKFAAMRELEEETGLRAEHWQELTCIDTTAGFCDEKITIYLATGLSQHEMHTDDDEFLAVQRFPLENAVQAVMNGEQRDSKTVIGLLMASRLTASKTAAPFVDASVIQRERAGFYSRQAEKNVQVQR